MSNECYLNDIAVVNKTLSDSLTVASGEKVNSMDYYSCNISEFDMQIQEGVILIFKNEELLKIEYCNHIQDSIKKFISNSNTDGIGVGIIYNIKNLSSQTNALKMIENYLSLIFKLN